MLNAIAPLAKILFNTVDKAVADKYLAAKLKSDLTGCKFIEPYDLMSKTSDGIHPTAEGHKLVCDFILKTIDTTSYK
jgi:lysophospholipase L1-like esterase